jgi:hypothetical protein
MSLLHHGKGHDPGWRQRDHRVHLHRRSKDICLERLPEPSPDEAPADETRGEGAEISEDVDTALVADGEPAEATEPGESPLDDPTMRPEPLFAIGHRVGRSGERSIGSAARGGSGRSRNPPIKSGGISGSMIAHRESEKESDCHAPPNGRMPECWCSNSRWRSRSARHGPNRRGRSVRLGAKRRRGRRAQRQGRRRRLRD